MVVPCGMTPPVSISIPNPPYHYDPTDDDMVSYGFVVEKLLSVPEITGNSTDYFLSFLTYRELTVAMMNMMASMMDIHPMTHTY
jgi:hypothetical protein